MDKGQRVSWVLRALVVVAPAMLACETKAPPPTTPAPTISTAMPMAASSSDSAIRVEVTSEGFQPSRVTLGADRRVVFRRVADGTCATAVVFPGLGIENALPLNTDVTVDLPPGSHGELVFQCGMGMYRGKAIAE